MKKRSSWWLLGALWLAGCGEAGTDVEAGSPSTEPRWAVVTQALDACTEASMVSTNDTCAGGFEFGIKCPELKPSTDCDISGWPQKTCYNPCEHVEHGVERRETQVKQVTVSPTSESHRECQLNEYGKPECETWTEYDYYGPCYAEASYQRSLIDSRYRDPVTYTVSVPYNYGRPATCTITLSNVPRYYVVGDAWCKSATNPGYSCDDTSQLPYRHACRSPNHPAVDGSQCGTTRMFTAPGSTRQAALDAAKAKWLALQDKVTTRSDVVQYTQQPQCLTCDSQPVGTQAEAQAKFTCLEGALAASTSLPAANLSAVETRTVKDMKLLNELRGDLLTDAQRQKALELAATRPGLKYDCGIAFVPPAGADASCGDLAALNGKLDLCTRLTGAYVTRPESTYANINACMDLATSVAPLDETLCKGKEYRDSYRALWLALLDKSNRNLPRDTDGVPTQEALRARLATIDRWYGVLRGSLYPGTTPADGAYKDLSRTFDLFWKATYAGSLLSDTSQQLKATDPLNLGLRIDRAILSAALSLKPKQNPADADQLTLQGAPLLTLLGDGLRGLNERLEDASLLHDLGCRFRDCRAMGVRTELSELWRLEGSAADATLLGTALDDADLLASAPQQRQAWWFVFETLKNRHGYIEDAVRQTLNASTYSASLLQDTPPASLPEPAVALARLIQSARARSDNYEKTGIFLATTRNSMPIGIQERKQEQLDQQITARKDALAAALGEYTRNRDAWVAARLAEMGNVQNRATLRNQLDLKMKRFEQVATDLVGLRANAALEEAAFGNFASAFNQALAAESADLGRMQIQREPPTPFSLSADTAHTIRWTPALRGQHVSQYAVQHDGADWSVQAALPGDIINVSATGQWAPSCALQLAELRKPLDTSSPLQRVSNANNALTGPEGYLVSYQTSDFQAQSNNSSLYAGSNLSARVCAGLKTEAGIGWNLIAKAEVEVYLQAEACLSGEVGARASEDSSTGSENRASASFNTGIRLPNTPFPYLPAGSLLVVQVERGGPRAGTVRDIKVVQAPNTSVLIGKTAGLATGVADPGVDVYLVANDSGSTTEGCVRNTADALSVSVQVLKPMGTSVKQMGAAMAQVWSNLRAAEAQYLAQGRVLPQEMVALRDSAMSQVYAACRVQTGCDATGTCNSACNMTQFPPSLMALFNTFVSKELARLERQVEIRAVERELELMTMEFKSLAEDLDAVDTQGRMLRLIPAWSLRNLDGESLRQSTRDLTVLATDFLFPVLDVRYPRALPSIQNEAALDNLVRADWTLPYVDLATQAKTAVERIVFWLNDARLRAPLTSYTRVALSIPRPGRPLPGNNLSNFRKVGSERALGIWEKLLNTPANQPLTFSIQVLPEDLYSNQGGGTAELLCSEGAPVLHRLAVYWSRPRASDNASLNSTPIRSKTNLGAALNFPTENGVRTYYVEDPTWRAGGNRMLFGQPNDAFTALQNFELNLPEEDQSSTGDGLSPFTTMEFDVSGFRNRISNPLDGTDEIILIMELDKRPVSSLEQPALCR